MRKNCLYIFFVLFLGCNVNDKNRDLSENKLALWYKQPALNWEEEALPIGNGRFGAMFFGGIQKEHLQFNDLTLWEGNTKVRGSYQNFGDVFVYFDHNEKVTDYRRELDIQKAIGNVVYKANGIIYKRSYFSSHADSVLVMRFSSSKKGSLNVKVAMHDARIGEKSVSGDQIEIKGKLDLLRYYAQLKAVTKGGEIYKEGDSLVISAADEVMLILFGSTDYDPKSLDFLSRTSPEEIVNRAITNSQSRSYDELLKNHINDYQLLFNRVSLNLYGAPLTRPTDSVLYDYKSGIYNLTLENIYFQYGRYLMISCSRKGLALPSNLQGIWNNSNNPPWQSDIHSNINVQMNYWPAEVTNLSECHWPFLEYIHDNAIVHPYWKNYASELGHRGWAMKTENNIFGLSGWNMNCPANAWYCSHLWQHYEFTLDTNFLKEVAYQPMKEACRFWLDRLVIDKKGQWLAPNEWSPEHGPWENGVAFAQQLIWDLFNSTIKASEVLNININDSFIDSLNNKFVKLDNGLEIGAWGQIKEWKYHKDDPEDDHRHISHLMGLYPGNQISPLIDSNFSNAAKVSLNARGDKSTGWATTHRINAWARLLDGDRALSIFRTYLLGGMTLNNLFDTHPPFQIDGNFGGTTGIASMLLQSHLGFIHILPALPEAWKRGEIYGLTAAGNFEVNIQWNKSKPSNIKINSKKGAVCNVLVEGAENTILKDDKGADILFTVNQMGVMTFNTIKGSSYNISWKR